MSVETLQSTLRLRDSEILAKDAELEENRNLLFKSKATIQKLNEALEIADAGKKKAEFERIQLEESYRSQNEKNENAIKRIQKEKLELKTEYETVKTTCCEMEIKLHENENKMQTLESVMERKMKAIELLENHQKESDRNLNQKEIEIINNNNKIKEMENKIEENKKELEGIVMVYEEKLNNEIEKKNNEINKIKKENEYENQKNENRWHEEIRKIKQEKAELDKFWKKELTQKINEMQDEFEEEKGKMDQGWIERMKIKEKEMNYIEKKYMQEMRTCEDNFNNKIKEIDNLWKNSFEEKIKYIEEVKEKEIKEKVNEIEENGEINKNKLQQRILLLVDKVRDLARREEQREKERIDLIEKIEEIKKTSKEEFDIRLETEKVYYELQRDLKAELYEKNEEIKKLKELCHNNTTQSTQYKNGENEMEKTKDYCYEIRRALKQNAKLKKALLKFDKKKRFQNYKEYCLTEASEVSSEIST